jgi:hypothetical protein
MPVFAKDLSELIYASTGISDAMKTFLREQGLLGLPYDVHKIYFYPNS